MAESMTYASLITDIQAYAERNDAGFVAQIPRFIMLAENRISSQIHGLGYKRVATFALSPGNPISNKPARWRETVSLSVKVDGQVVFLKLRGYEYCRAYWPDQTQRGVPEYYSDYDYSHHLMVPTPDIAYPAEMVYHERPVPLDNSNQVNWTTQYAPQLLLYATILEAQVWLKLYESMSVYQGLYEKAAGEVITESQRRLNGDESLTRREG